MLLLWFLMTLAFLPMRLSSRRSTSFTVTFSRITLYSMWLLVIWELFAYAGVGSYE